MKAIKFLFLTLALFLGMSNSLNANTFKNQITINPELDKLAQNLSKDSAFQDRIVGLLTLNEIAKISIGYNETAKAELSNLAKQKASVGRDSKMASLLGFKDNENMNSFLSVFNTTTKSSAISALDNLSINDKQYVVSQASQLFTTEANLESTLVTKMSNSTKATAKCIKKCLNIYNGCTKVPAWKKGLQYSCEIVGIVAIVGADVATAGSLSATAVAAFVAVCTYCVEEFSAANASLKGRCNRAYDKCLDGC